MFEEQLVNLLKTDLAVRALVDGRIYLMPAEQGAASPFLTYLIVFANPSGRSYDGGCTADITGVQIDAWDEDLRGRSVPLARAVRAALDNVGLVGGDVVERVFFEDWRDLNNPDSTPAPDGLQRLRKEPVR